MDIRALNPLDRPDWDARLPDLPASSFFLTAAWAKVLAESYGYEPLYFTACDGDRVTLLMPMMGVTSRLTGRRGVSLPFTDQCPTFALSQEDFLLAQRRVIGHGKDRGWRYVEWRSDRHFGPDVPFWDEFYTHTIDLGREEKVLFSGLSDNNRRNVRKASREGVTVRFERTPEALRAFYRLNLITRKRHGLPPQPFKFFENLNEFVISKELGVIASAYHQGKAVACSVFLQFGGEAIFKYGASDMSFQYLRPNNLLMWEACAFFARQGVRTLNLGRTDLWDDGLLRFKRTWGAEEALIRYYRYDLGKDAFVRKRAGAGAWYPKVFARVPIPLARLIGRFAYRHVG